MDNAEILLPWERREQISKRIRIIVAAPNVYAAPTAKMRSVLRMAMAAVIQDDEERHMVTGYLVGSATPKRSKDLTNAEVWALFEYVTPSYLNKEFLSSREFIQEVPVLLRQVRYYLRRYEHATKPFSHQR